MNESMVRHHSSAERKAQALIEIEKLIEGGKSVRAAVEEVACRTGIGERSLFTYRQKTNFAPRDEWETVLARQGYRYGSRGMVAKCDPRALQRFIGICRGGKGITASFQQIESEALEHGWAPIPCERTLRRELDRQFPPVERYSARRNAQPIVEA